MYCNRGSLAADETVLQDSLVGSRFVLQYKLYCELGEGLGRDTAWAGAGCARSAQAGWRRRAGVLSRRRQSCWARAGCAAGGAQARGARQAGAGRAGRAGWLWAVHSVHSACFWAGSTRYFPESNFLNIVREPGS